jgi:hypothetical protein
MMCPAINNSKCGIRGVIRFLHAKNMSAAKIQRELWIAVHGQNVTSKGTVKQWC